MDALIVVGKTKWQKYEQNGKTFYFPQGKSDPSYYWIATMDPGRGKPYFVHKASKKTLWQLPDVISEEAAKAKSNYEVLANGDLQVGKTIYEKKVSPKGIEFYIPQGKTPQDKDFVWRMCKDDASGRTYFVNRNNVTKWKLQDLNATAEGDEESSEAADPSEKTAEPASTEAPIAAVVQSVPKPAPAQAKVHEAPAVVAPAANAETTVPTAPVLVVTAPAEADATPTTPAGAVASPPSHEPPVSPISAQRASDNIAPPAASPTAQTKPGALRVRIVKATGLENKDLGGKSDPFVSLRVANSTAKSTCKDNSTDPVWNETFDMVVEVTVSGTELVCHQELLAEVFDKDLVGKDLMGSALFALNDLPHGKGIPRAEQLRDGQGVLHLILEAIDFGIGAPELSQPEVDAYGRQSIEKLASKEANSRIRFKPASQKTQDGQLFIRILRGGLEDELTRQLTACVLVDAESLHRCTPKTSAKRWDWDEETTVTVPVGADHVCRSQITVQLMEVPSNAVCAQADIPLNDLCKNLGITMRVSCVKGKSKLGVIVLHLKALDFGLEPSAEDETGIEKAESKLQQEEKDEKEKWVRAVQENNEAKLAALLEKQDAGRNAIGEEQENSRKESEKQFLTAKKELTRKEAETRLLAQAAAFKQAQEQTAQRTALEKQETEGRQSCVTEEQTERDSVLAAGQQAETQLKQEEEVRRREADAAEADAAAAAAAAAAAKLEEQRKAEAQRKAQEEAELAEKVAKDAEKAEKLRKEAEEQRAEPKTQVPMPEPEPQAIPSAALQKAEEEIRNLREEMRRLKDSELARKREQEEMERKWEEESRRRKEELIDQLRQETDKQRKVWMEAERKIRERETEDEARRQREEEERRKWESEERQRRLEWEEERKRWVQESQAKTSSAAPEVPVPVTVQPTAGLLRITVVKAVQLRHPQGNQRGNLFLTIHAPDGSESRTNVQQGTLTPSWGEDFVLTVPTFPQGDDEKSFICQELLRFTIWDEAEESSAECIGRGSHPLQGLIRDTTQEAAVALSPQGWVYLRIKATNFGLVPLRSMDSQHKTPPTQYGAPFAFSPAYPPSLSPAHSPLNSPRNARSPSPSSPVNGNPEVHEFNMHVNRNSPALHVSLNGEAQQSPQPSNPGNTEPTAPPATQVAPPAAEAASVEPHNEQTRQRRESEKIAPGTIRVRLLDTSSLPRTGLTLQFQLGRETVFLPLHSSEDQRVTIPVREMGTKLLEITAWDNASASRPEDGEFIGVGTTLLPVFRELEQRDVESQVTLRQGAHNIGSLRLSLKSAPPDVPSAVVPSAALTAFPSLFAPYGGATVVTPVEPLSSPVGPTSWIQPQSTSWASLPPSIAPPSPRSGSLNGTGTLPTTARVLSKEAELEMALGPSTSGNSPRAFRLTAGALRSETSPPRSRSPFSPQGVPGPQQLTFSSPLSNLRSLSSQLELSSNVLLAHRLQNATLQLEQDQAERQSPTRIPPAPATVAVPAFESEKPALTNFPESVNLSNQPDPLSEQQKLRSDIMRKLYDLDAQHKLLAEDLGRLHSSASVAQPAVAPTTTQPAAWTTIISTSSSNGGNQSPVAITTISVPEPKTHTNETNGDGDDLELLREDLQRQIAYALEQERTRLLHEARTAERPRPAHRSRSRSRSPAKPKGRDSPLGSFSWSQRAREALQEKETKIDLMADPYRRKVAELQRANGPPVAPVRPDHAAALESRVQHLEAILKTAGIDPASTHPASAPAPLVNPLHLQHASLTVTPDGSDASGLRRSGYRAGASPLRPSNNRSAPSPLRPGMTSSRPPGFQSHYDFSPRDSPLRTTTTVTTVPIFQGNPLEPPNLDKHGLMREMDHVGAELERTQNAISVALNRNRSQLEYIADTKRSKTGGSQALPPGWAEAAFQMHNPGGFSGSISPYQQTSHPAAPPGATARMGVPGRTAFHGTPIKAKPHPLHDSSFVAPEPLRFPSDQQFVPTRFRSPASARLRRSPVAVMSTAERFPMPPPGPGPATYDPYPL
eukprot:TRINITY_DN13070_c0_g1_i1.p1 TRINITY_DN13070_c0_g1~~TRINITY_DN13070_c0_g1_i1.p1  ORF type:complete len:2027 (+),score=283.28 TRINITY_DN13070_c0_g1_i1:52-6081(+)